MSQDPYDQREDLHRDKVMRMSGTTPQVTASSASMRMQCLQLALTMHGEPHSHDQVLAAAKAFEQYILKGADNG